MEEGMNGSQVAEKGETLFLTSRRCPQLYPLSTSLNDSLGNSWALGLCSTWGREAQSLNKDYLEELGQGAPRQEGSLRGCSGPGHPVEEAWSVQLCPAVAPPWLSCPGWHTVLPGSGCSGGRQAEQHCPRPHVQRSIPQDLERQHAHIGIMVEFSTALMSKLDGINRHSFNSFRLRVGEALGRWGGLWLRAGLRSPGSPTLSGVCVAICFEKL